MTRQTITIINDDITGEEDAETVEFAIDGIAYQIDLVEENRRKMLDIMAPYIDNARRVGKTGATLPRAKPAMSNRVSQKSDPAFIRRVKAWAKENDVYVPPRGRIPGTVYAAYSEAGGS